MRIPSDVEDRLRSGFEDLYGTGGELLLVRTPGRTEICGNHTDHEGGHVVAGAVDRHVWAIFSPSEGPCARIFSEGYGMAEVDVSDLSPNPEERGTSRALVRGVASAFAERGFEPHGFDAFLMSEVPMGSGLSSSAAYEVTVAAAANVLWAGGALSPVDLAVMSQHAENVFFGKPCGLMDQAAVALGGVQLMGFSDPGKVEAWPLDVDFGDEGYALCLVSVGADHSAKTDDYAAVPREMQDVARVFGQDRLCDVEEQDFLVRVSEVRGLLGDRACLRALHYWREERLVLERAEALGGHDIEAFLKLERDSGASSAMFLQNVSCGIEEQPSMLALALSEEYLRGRGATRVHGGGFGGTIQSFVPLERVGGYTELMDSVFGDGACGVYAIDHEGATAEWL